MKHGHTLSSSSSLTLSECTSPLPTHRLSADDDDLDSEDGEGGEEGGEGLPPESAAGRSLAGRRVASRRGLAMKKFGSIMFLVGGILNFVSMGFAAQSLLASLGSAQFVSNVAFGRLVLGERVTLRTWFATVVICLGNGVIVLHSNRESREYTASELLWAYTTGYRYYLLACLAALLVVHCVHSRITTAINTRTKKTLPVPKYLTSTQGITYSLSSAVLGTQQMVAAKCMSELLRLTTTGSNQLLHPFTYAVIAMYVVATVFWLYRMNVALQMYEGLFIIPVLQVRERGGGKGGGRGRGEKREQGRAEKASRTLS